MGAETFFDPSTELVRLVLANFTPALLVAPAVLLVAGRRSHLPAGLSRSAATETALIVAAVLATSVLVFYSAPEIGRYPWLLVLVFPPLVWTALRLGPMGASVSLLTVGALSLAGAAHQRGPFVVNASDDIVFSLLLFWIVISLPILLLAAAVNERETKRRAKEDQRRSLVRTAHETALAELSSAVANELSQPLTAILANAAAGRLLLAHQPIDVEELRATLADIECEARVPPVILEHLRCFARGKEPAFESLDIEAVLRDALSLSSDALALVNVDVQLEVAPNLPKVRADRLQLLQVVLNLKAHSCASVPPVDVPRRQLRLQVTQADRHHVQIALADSWTPLPNGDGERVFEHVFPMRQGHAALNLPIARSIVRAHGGRLWVEPNASGGVTFNLVLAAEGNSSFQELTAQSPEGR
jgi:signal transduction histidine kinase